jgi:hypothetical protein
MGKDPRAGTSRPPTSHDILKPFHSSIVQWRADGLVYREIAKRLEKAAGLDVDFNDVARYCKAENIQAEPPQKLPPTRKDMAGKGRQQQPKAVVGSDDGADASANTQSAAPARSDEPADDQPTVAEANRPPRQAVSKSTSAKKPNLAARAREIAAGLSEAPAAPTADGEDASSADELEPADSDVADEPMTEPEPAPAAPAEDGVEDAAVDESDDLGDDDDADIEREQAARTDPENTPREQDATAFVHQGLGANKTTREQAAGASLTAPEPPPPDIAGFLAESIQTLATCCRTPEAFYESLATTVNRLDELAQSAPPEQQQFYRERIADLRKDLEAHTPEKLKQRSRLQKIRDWIGWQAMVGRYKLAQAAAPSQPPPPVHQPSGSQPMPSVAPPSAPAPPQAPPSAAPPRQAATQSQRRLFVPLERVPLWTADLELLTFNGGADRFTLADACEGVAIFGSTGSGKTSGSGQALARSYLGAGFGGLVLTAKADECELWQRYAEVTGRTEQLCIVRPGGPFAFNFLDYQARLPEAQGGSTVNAVELLFAILAAYAKSQPRSSADMYWENTARELLTNILRVFRAADELLTLDKLRQFMSEAPHSRKEVKSGAFKDGKLFAPLLARASRLSRGTPSEVTIDEAERFWMTDFPRLDERPRSIVESHLTSMINMFFEPQVWQLFCGGTTITPEAVFDGAVIVVDVPVERNLSIGRIAAIIFKHFFQLAVPRRIDPRGPTQRPVFLWADEAQNFTTAHDSIFQATARSARAATVYLTQTISNYYAEANGDKHRVNGFFSNLNTKIFHSNNDPETNHWAAEMIGKSIKYRSSQTTRDEPNQGMGNWWQSRKPSTSTTTNSQMDYEIQPADFGKLRTGGIHPDRPEDDLQVDAYLFKSGARFSNGKNFFGTTFLQG